LRTCVSTLVLPCNVPSMAKTGPDSGRTAFEVFDTVSMLMLRMSLQALPVFLTIAAGQIIARHL
jgi:hypothetical protein